MSEKRIIRGLALTGTAAITLAMTACATDDAADDSANGTAATAASADAADGTSPSPGAAAASSQPETEMPEAEDAGPHNNADVSFNRMMMAHHQQAVAKIGRASCRERV